MAEFTWNIEKHHGVIAEYKGWKKELNEVKWGENPSKYDIRDWNEDHSRMKKGVTLTEEELIELRDLLNDMNLE